MSTNDSLKLALDEGQKVLDTLSERIGWEQAQKAQIPALAWGMFKAIMECPDCPGHFRVPVDFGDGQEWIHCPNCDGYWVYSPKPESGTAGGTKRKGHK